MNNRISNCWSTQPQCESSVERMSARLVDFLKLKPIRYCNFVMNPDQSRRSLQCGVKIISYD